jgi:hypothetical protein
MPVESLLVGLFVVWPLDAAKSACRTTDRVVAFGPEAGRSRTQPCPPGCPVRPRPLPDELAAGPERRTASRGYAYLDFGGWSVMARGLSYSTRAKFITS